MRAHMFIAVCKSDNVSQGWYSGNVDKFVRNYLSLIPLAPCTHKTRFNGYPVRTMLLYDYSHSPLTVGDVWIFVCIFLHIIH